MLSWIFIVGDLVIATGNDSPDNELFRKSGNLGNQWNQGIVDFTGAQNMKVNIFCVFFLPSGSYSRKVRT
jgi:hypothetical protein